MVKTLSEFVGDDLSEHALLYYVYMLTRDKGTATIQMLKNQFGITDDNTEEFSDFLEKLERRKYIERHSLAIEDFNSEGFVTLTPEGKEIIQKFID